MVWYFSYGSNMLFERFKLYIVGGNSPLVGRSYVGCSNKNLPNKIEFLKIPHELYFAKSAPFWDGGAIAFIKSKPSASKFSYGKAYLISKDQFFEIINQENTQFSSKYLSKSYSEMIDFEELKKSKYIEIGPQDENIEYGKVMYLGNKDKFPIVTFTSKHDFDENEINQPSYGYLSVIIRGLLEYKKFSSIENIHSYLFAKSGIFQYYSSKELFKLINNANQELINNYTDNQ